MNASTYILLIPLLPLLSFVVLGLLGRRYLQQWSGAIATSLLLLATVLAGYTCWQYFTTPTDGGYTTTVLFRHSWLVFTDRIAIEMGMLLDPLSVMMLVVVTFVSLMVHLFSTWYMKGDERLVTYFAFLGLFTFSMLGLVVATNLFQIYIFWELVGVSSFLLIGYYFQKPAAVAAAKKAFIVTRFADLGFLVGILILAFYGETLHIPDLLQTITNKSSVQHQTIVTTSFAGITALTWGLCLVFMGGAGKSAMFPLHIWLPDAMEGPTPVSALIHAATMVVAGVFLVARLFPLYSLSQSALDLVTITGLISAVIAAVIACTQTDIKRILAYSTMSQIGYMMFALGLIGAHSAHPGGYTASLFHLFTHACFKSLLFLGAGAVIHAVHSNLITEMGGLRKQLPVTHISFLVACLAIAGIFPLSGFFSKEAILHTAWESSKPVYYVALLTSGLTAFYMFRLYFTVFWGRSMTHPPHHGEGGMAMKLPLLLLMLCTIGAGLLPFDKLVTLSGKPGTAHLDLFFALPPAALSLAGILLARWLYSKENNRPAALATGWGALYRWAYHKFYIDELYQLITRQVFFRLLGRTAAWVDKQVVDGAVNGVALATASVATRIRGLQSGRVQQYALVFFGGVALLALLFIYLWK